jgi:hypothetical protein
VTETAAEKLARRAAEARARLIAAKALPRDLRDEPTPLPVTETIPAQHWTEQDTDKDEEDAP